MSFAVDTPTAHILFYTHKNPDIAQNNMRPKMLPTERSKWPEIISNVTALPVIITKETCLVTLPRLVIVRNASENMAKATPIIINMPTMTSFCRISLLIVRRMLIPLTLSNYCHNLFRVCFCIG